MRASVWAVRAALGFSLMIELGALHFPAPSGVDEASRARVTGAWVLAGRVLRAVADRVPDGVVHAIDPLIDDKMVHFMLFLPLGVLLAMERRLRVGRGGAVRLVVALAGYAALGEFSQGWGGRIADPGDWLANVLGAAVGVGLVVLTGGRQRASSIAETRPFTDLS